MTPAGLAREIDRRVSPEEICAAIETEITAAERESFNERDELPASGIEW